MGRSGEKSQAKSFFQYSNLPQLFLRGNPTRLGNYSVPNFCKTGFRYF